jgi:hypothetical protein
VPWAVQSAPWGARCAVPQGQRSPSGTAGRDSGTPCVSVGFLGPWSSSLSALRWGGLPSERLDHGGIVVALPCDSHLCVLVLVQFDTLYGKKAAALYTQVLLRENPCGAILD